MEALSPWDKKEDMDSSLFESEMKLANQALDILASCIKSIKGYNPIIDYVEGNHEFRVSALLKKNKTFSGIIEIYNQLKLKKRKINWTPFPGRIMIEGIAFTHVPINENGKPIAGQNIAKKALSYYNSSVVFGHTHRLCIESVSRHSPDGGVIEHTGISVGCFFEHNEDYREGAVNNVQRCLVILDTKRDLSVCSIPMWDLIDEYEESIKKVKNG